ncbi:MAG: hypothetical protein HYU75_16100, partial [Betaproteobacteria bacterium]|nr:hypothetical protein [Betaproteobacteria bacterium]
MKKLVCAMLAALPFAFGNAAIAQQFSGRVVTMIVNYTAGGATDVDARIVARHLPKHVQGLSSIVVRNVGGAGGNIGVNQLGESSEHERLNLGFFTWDPVAQLVQEKSLRVRYNDLKFVAGFSQPQLIYIRRDAPPGINRPADVAKAQRFKAGALGPSVHGTVRQRLALDLLGAKYETITGYKGLVDIDLAIRQGHLQSGFNSLSGYFSTVKPNLVDTGIVMPLFQYDYELPDGTLGR